VVENIRPLPAVFGDIPAAAAAIAAAAAAAATKAGVMVPSLDSAVTDVAEIRAIVLRTISEVLDDGEVGWCKLKPALKTPGFRA